MSILVVWAFYPESNQRTLEEMNLVFASASIWNWDAEKNYKILIEENPEIVQAARRGNSIVDPETGLPVQRQSITNRHGSYSTPRTSGAQRGSTEDEKV